MFVLASTVTSTLAFITSNCLYMVMFSVWKNPDMVLVTVGRVFLIDTEQQSLYFTGNALNYSNKVLYDWKQPHLTSNKNE